MPERLRAVRRRLVDGDGAAEGRRLEQLVDGTNAALESLRELTRGVFPTQLGRAGVEPAVRSFLARTGSSSALHVDASAVGRRFSPRVEAAVYFCCVEAAGTGSRVSSILLRVDGPSLLLRIEGASDDVDRQAVVDRVEAVGGSFSAGPDLLMLSIPADVSSDAPRPSP
jgi:hypothetical protein